MSFHHRDSHRSFQVLVHHHFEGPAIWNLKNRNFFFSTIFDPHLSDSSNQLLSFINAKAETESQNLKKSQFSENFEKKKYRLDPKTEEMIMSLLTEEILDEERDEDWANPRRKLASSWRIARDHASEYVPSLKSCCEISVCFEFLGSTIDYNILILESATALYKLGTLVAHFDDRTLKLSKSSSLFEISWKLDAFQWN